MTRCSCYWADVSHLTWWKLNSNHARVINRKEESCVSKKLYCSWCSIIILWSIALVFPQQFRICGHIQALMVLYRLISERPSVPTERFFFSLFLPSCLVVQFRHAQTSRRWHLYPPRWVQVCPTEQKSRTYEEPAQPQAERGNAGGGGWKDDGQPRPWEHHHVCSHCAKHGEARC